MFGICIIILIPLCLIKEISRMRITSFLSVSSLIFTIFVVVIESPMYYEEFMKSNPKYEINWFDISTGFTSELTFFTGGASIFFTYCSHNGAFPIYKSLKNNVSRRINKVFRRSIILNTIIYFFVGIAGFLTRPQDAKDLIIYRPSKFSSDLFMIIGRLLISVCLILSTPANYNGFRIAFMELKGWDTNEISNKQ